MPDVIELAAPAGVDPPLWLQNATYPALVDRDLIDAIWSSAGIVLAGDLAVTPRGTGANMSVDVAAGRAVVVGTDAAGQGKYLCRATSTVNLAVGVAPGPGTSRIDLVVAHVYDDAVIGGAQHFWQPEIVAGTAAASPVAPPQPPSSLLLATLTIPTGLASVAAGNITDRRAVIAAPGSRLLVPPAQQSAAAQQGGILNTSDIALTGLACTFTLAATRWLRFRGYCPATISSANAVPRLMVNNGTTNVRQQNSPSGAAASVLGAWIEYLAQIAAGTYTYSLHAQNGAGGGTTWSTAWAANDPATFTVEDLGI